MRRQLGRSVIVVAIAAMGLLGSNGFGRLNAPLHAQEGRAAAAASPGLYTQIFNPEGGSSGAARASGVTVPSSGTAVWVPAEKPVSGAAGGLTINAIFDSSITTDTNAATIMAAINTAIANEQAAFSDPITVTINFAKGGGLGGSSTYYATGTYSSYLAALKADATSSDDATAVSLLPTVSTNPVNGSTSINVKLATLRAVGIVVNPPTGQPDGFITLNTALTTPGSPGSTLRSNLTIVAEHEIDEVLGLSSALPSVPSGTIFPQDLSRYNQNGARTFTSTDSRNSGIFAYFSLDGTTRLAEFDNQNDGGDFGDWQSNPLRGGVVSKVQDAFATVGVNPALSVELVALDVIGFTRVPASCTYTISPNGISINASATTGSVTVTGDAGCAWTATSNTPSVVTVTGGSSGVGNGTVNYSVSANAGASRVGTIAIADKTFTVTQAGCAFALSSSSATAYPSAGSGTVNVTTTSACTWTASSNAGFLGITGGSSGTGNGTVTYSVAVNNSVPRSGTLTIAGLIFTVSQGMRARPSDFDGDGKSDIAVMRPSTGTWYIRYTGTPTAFDIVWGGGSDIPVPCDYDGDGKVDIAVFRPSTGTWFIRYTGTPTAFDIVWGGGTDIPVPSDYDGDGKVDIAVFRPSTGTWFIRYTGTPTAFDIVWGGGSDIPVPQDYDGDGKTDIAVFRPSTGTWFIRYTQTPTAFDIVWGGGTDVPVAADYDGDNKADIAVFRKSTGTWFIRYTQTPTAFDIVWGGGSDTAVPGDFDGDNKTDIAVMRPSTGTWYIRYTQTPTAFDIVWGGGSDIPTLRRP